MFETHLTVVGTLITRVERLRFADGTTKAYFRIACNERRFDRAANGWTNGGKLYLSVNCWRDLAENVLASFVVGDPIIVRGRLLTREWEKEGRRNSMTELEASAVGPDLSRSTAKITRTKRGAAALGVATDEAGADPADSGDGVAPTGPAAPGGDPWQDAGSGRSENVNSHDGFEEGEDSVFGDDDWRAETGPLVPEPEVEAAVRG